MRFVTSRRFALASVLVIAAACAGDDAASPDTSPATLPATTATPTATEPPVTEDLPAEEEEGPPATEAPGPDPMEEWIEVDLSGVPLPLPAMRMARDLEAMSPGYTMFNAINITNVPGFETDDPIPGALLMLDANGEVAWYHTAPQFIGDATLTPQGTILYIYGDGEAHEVNADGELVRRWLTQRSQPWWTDELVAAGFDVDVPTVVIETETIHHEAVLLESGNLLFLSTAVRILDQPEPMCGEDPATYPGFLELIEDVIIEATPDGEIVKEVSLFDALDPGADREGRRVCGPDLIGRAFPLSHYDEGGTRPVIDWTHGNAVVIDEERNVFLASLRHLSATVALRYEDDDDGPAGELLWELSPYGDLEVTAGTTLPSFQHAVEVQPDGTIMLFDNGNERQPFVSRAVQYDIDGTTVDQVWEYIAVIDGVELFSFAVSDADRLPNGNVLITNGFLNGVPNELSVHIVEVVPEPVSGGRPVFDLRIDGGSDGWFVYRAERVPSDFLEQTR